MNFRNFRLLVLVSIGCSALVSLINVSGAIAAETPEELNQEIRRMQEKAISYLKLTQAEDGSWTDPQILGITALCTKGLIDAGLTKSDEAVSKGLQFLLKHRQPDGGIYNPESKHKNYETAITLIALKDLNDQGEYDDVIAKAARYLKQLQWDEGEQVDPSNPYYGGAGYGGHQRPDMSNTQFFLDALMAAGLDEDDPAVQKALIFVSRAQNLESEHNTTEFASKVNDGGFYYTAAAGGTSQAGKTPNGGLRSYASMTYAGLKSMIYAGVKPDDKRVKAANKWIQMHYSVTENPGLGQQGLYYYYHTFAKSLSVMRKSEVVDDKGVAHNWKKDLVTQLKSTQQQNGSWVNTADRWYEGDPNLVTAYALMALKHCVVK